MSNIIPDSTALLDDDSVDIIMCRFCSKSHTESNVEQVEHDSFSAAITCLACNSVVSSSCTESTPEKALWEIKKLYNKTPRYKHNEEIELPSPPVLSDFSGLENDLLKMERYQGQLEMWEACNAYVAALQKDNQQLFDEGCGEYNRCMFAIYRFFELRRVHGDSLIEKETLLARVSVLEQTLKDAGLPIPG